MPLHGIPTSRCSEWTSHTTLSTCCSTGCGGGAGSQGGSLGAACDHLRWDRCHLQAERQRAERLRRAWHRRQPAADQNWRRGRPQQHPAHRHDQQARAPHVLPVTRQLDVTRQMCRCSWGMSSSHMAKWPLVLLLLGSNAAVWQCLQRLRHSCWFQRKWKKASLCVLMHVWALHCTVHLGCSIATLWQCLKKLKCSDSPVVCREKEEWNPPIFRLSVLMHVCALHYYIRFGMDGAGRTCWMRRCCDRAGLKSRLKLGYRMTRADSRSWRYGGKSAACIMQVAGLGRLTDSVSDTALEDSNARAEVIIILSTRAVFHGLWFENVVMDAQIHTGKMSANSFLGKDVDLWDLAQRCKNFSGAEIEGLVKSATSFALNRQVDFTDLSKPIDDENLKVPALHGLLPCCQETVLQPDTLWQARKAVVIQWEPCFHAPVALMHFTVTHAYSLRIEVMHSEFMPCEEASIWVWELFFLVGGSGLDWFLDNKTQNKREVGC